MLELEKFGVIEMTSEEQNDVEGGLLEWLFVGLVIGILWAIGNKMNP